MDVRREIRATVVLGLLLVVGMIGFRGVVWSVLSKIMLGALLAWLLCPLARALERRMSRTSASLCSVLAFALALTALVALLLPPLVEQLSALSKGLPQVVQSGRSWLTGALARLHIDADALIVSVGDALGRFGADALPHLLRGAGSIASFLAALLFSLVLAVYFLKDRELFLLYLSMLVPLRVRRKCLYACAQVRRELSGYVRGQLIVAACVAALTAVGLFFVRVPYYLVLGLLMGLLDVIPYFGPIIGALPIVIFSAQIGWRGMIWALGIVIFVQQLEANLLVPRVMGRSTGLHPVTVMLGVLSFGALAGVGGMLAAVPCMLGARAVFRVMRTEP